MVSAEESSTQVEVAFTRALTTEEKDHLLDAQLLDELGRGSVPDHHELPVLLALSDNGPQMTSRSTKAFLAGARIATHFGRPATPNDQAWIESFFGHLKAEHPHLLAIDDPEVLRGELAVIRSQYNGVRLHAGIGYVCPNDEHEGRGQAIRKAREAGLEDARLRRLAYHRQQRPAAPPRGPRDVD